MTVTRKRSVSNTVKIWAFGSSLGSTVTGEFMHIMQHLVSAAAWAFVNILSSGLLASHERNVLKLSPG